VATRRCPTDTASVAILRKNVVVLWSPSGLAAQRDRKPSKPKIKGIDDLAGHRVGVVGRTQVNVTLLRVILAESGVNPDKVAVAQFSTDQIAEMVRDPTIDAFMTVGPLEQQDHRGRDHLDRAPQGRADVSPDRGFGSHRPQASAV
jgi:ABC-type amino acid transport substrate-binding protein